MTQPSLPYAHLNLRRNPFGDFSEADRAALAIVDIDDIVRRLSEPKFVVQFVGEKGYGKTTHLLAIRAQFPDAGYVHIQEGEKAALPTGSPILIDEAQRLTLLQRRRLFRQAVPLVLGTHFDFESDLRRAGRNVLTISVEQHTNVERLHQLLNARIEWVRRTSAPIPAVTQKTAATLLEEFGPNVRGILGRLYDSFENLQHVDDI